MRLLDSFLAASIAFFIAYLSRLKQGQNDKERDTCRQEAIQQTHQRPSNSIP
jgi:hypothetical protein